MTKNTESTRFYSEIQEKKISNLLEGYLQSNSGAGKFKKGDVVNKDASLLIECKCSMSDKDSFSIKKEWITKNELERKEMRLTNSCIAFRFGPIQEDYFIINEKLMKFLVEKLKEENLDQGEIS